MISAVFVCSYATDLKIFQLVNVFGDCFKEIFLKKTVLQITVIHGHLIENIRKKELQTLNH